jgi:hypothetical protein
MRSKFIKFGNLLSIILIVGTLLGGLIAYWADSALTLLVLSAGLAGWHGLVLVVGSLLANAVGASRFARLCIIGIAIVVIQTCVGMLLGYNSHLQNMREVRLYSQELVTHLEIYKAQNGRYPDQLSLVTAPRGNSPHFTSDTLLYFQNGDRFLLSVLDPERVNHFWLYDSINKEWKLTRF